MGAQLFPPSVVFQRPFVVARPRVAPSPADAVPGRGVQRVGRRRVHTNRWRRRGLPRAPSSSSAAVGRLEDAAVLVGRPLVAGGGDVDDVGVGGMDDDAGDGGCGLEPHVFPRLAGVGRLEDAQPGHGAAEDVGFARAGPDDVGIGHGDGQVTDGHGRLIVEDRLPGRAGVHGLEDAARGRAGIEDRAAAGGDGDVGAAPAEVEGADEAPLDVLERRLGLEGLVAGEGLEAERRVGILDLDPAFARGLFLRRGCARPDPTASTRARVERRDRRMGDLRMNVMTRQRNYHNQGHNARTGP